MPRHPGQTARAVDSGEPILAVNPDGDYATVNTDAEGNLKVSTVDQSETNTEGDANSILAQVTRTNELLEELLALMRAIYSE